MYDYMRALQARFSADSGSQDMEVEIRQLHRELATELSKKQRSKLLLLLDKQDARCQELSLQNFVAGFRLASGITRELSFPEQYSYEREQENSSYEPMDL